MQNQIPEQTGKILQSIFESPNDMLLIHRIDYDLERIQKSIFQFGIPMRISDYTSHLSAYRHFPSILMNIKVCNEYKMAWGCVLVRIPQNNQLPIDCKREGYLKGSSQLFLLSEYIWLCSS